MFGDLKQLPIEKLRENLFHVQAEKKSYATIEKNITDEIIRRYNERIASELRAKDDPFGTVNIDNIKFTVPKKVEWDQAALSQLYKEIGDTAEEYMSVEYKVKEAAYKNWPSAIQEAFIPARTVKAGSIKIEFKEE